MTDFNFIQDRFELPSAIVVNFEFGSTAFYILAGTSNTFSAVWATPMASRTSGKLYITSYGDGAAFNVLDLGVKLIYDRYTTSVKGRANQVLKQNYPEDVVV